MAVSLIIPAYNEEKGLPKVVEEAYDYVEEIIIVDDGSKDKTLKVAQKLAQDKKIKVIKHKKNSGKVAALRTGVKASTKDILIFTDADFTYPAKHFPEIVATLKNSELVLGSRFKKRIQNMALLNLIGNRIFSLVTSYIAGDKITDGQTGLRAMRKKDFKKLDVDATGLEYETKMTVRAAKLGYRIKEIPINYRKRIGKSKLNPIKDGYKMFISPFIIAFSETSLLARTVIIPGIFSLLIGLIFGLLSVKEYLDVIVFQSIDKYNHPFYPLITVFSVLFGTQLISMGLLIDNLSKKLHRIEEKLRR